MFELSTTIVAATVFPDRVRLTRRGAIKVEQGTCSIVLSRLPLTIIPETLHASIYGAVDTRLLGVQVKLVTNTDQVTDKVKQLESEIEAAQDELTQLDDKAGLIKQNRGILDQLAGQTDTYANALASGEMTVEKQLNAINHLRKQAQTLDDEIHKVQREQRTIKRRLEGLSSELEQSHKARPQAYYTATIDVESAEGGDLTIEVNYVISGAGWKPVYDLRLLEKQGTPSLEVSYLADVTQSTGENWDEISMTLSTARPALTSTIPDLNPWYIHPPETFLAGSQELPLSFTATLADGEVNTPPVELPNPRVEQTDDLVTLASTVGTSVSYIIPYTISLPSDGYPHKFSIARFFLVPELDYLSTPKLVQAVYRRARVENNSPYTLLPGDANILIGDEYVGITPFSLTVPGGTIELYLGNDNRIKVERDLKRRDIDKRWIGNRQHFVFGYEISLENMLSVSAKITLYDQIPIPDHNDIKVRLEAIIPKATEQSELNQLMWSLELEPKEKRTVRYDFSIDSPQDMNIRGLP